MDWWNSIRALLAKFHATTGHKHTGVAGDGPKLDATNTHESPSTDTHHAQAHKLNSHTVPDGDISLNSKKITSLLAGTANTHAVNKGQLDGRVPADLATLSLEISYSLYPSSYNGNLFFRVKLWDNQAMSGDAILDLDTGIAQTNFKAFTGTEFQNLTDVGFSSTWASLFYLWSSVTRNTYYGYWQWYHGSTDGDKVPLIINTGA